MFEFDPAKSALNKDKHGIDFVEAQALWKDEDRIEQAVVAAQVEEPNAVSVVGMMGRGCSGRGGYARRAARGSGSSRSGAPERTRLKLYERNKDNGRDITLEEFDAKFDRWRGASATIVDWSAARRPNLETKRVNVDFPAWVVAGLDRQAKRLGVTRQALIKMWIAERVG